MTRHPIISDTSINLSDIEGKKYIPRAAAYLIDSAFLWVLNVGTGYITSLLIGKEMLTLTGLAYGRGFAFPGIGGITLTAWVGVALVVVYFTLFECLYGCTLGKLILGMRIVSLKSDRPSLSQSFVRGIFRLFDGLFFGLIALTNMKPPYQQRFGDVRAETMVVSKASPLVKSTPPWWYFFLAMGLYVLLVSILRVITLS